MTEYFTDVSFVLSVPPEHRQWFVDYVDRAAEEDDADQPLRVEIEDDGERGLWFHADDDGYVSLGPLAEMLQQYLKEMRPDGCVGFEAAHHANKPRTDAFGGSAVLITAQRIQWTHTSKWLDEKLKKALAGRSPKINLNVP